MNLANKTKKTLRNLQVMYKSGIIAYPRVDNSFISDDKAFDMYAHPSFSFGEGIFKSIQGSEEEVNKKSSLILLSLLRILSPSNIESFSELIDEFFDDNLEYVSKEKEEEAINILGELASFMEEEDLIQSKLLEDYGSIFEKSKKRVMSIYKNDNLQMKTDRDSKIPRFVRGAIKTIDNKDVADVSDPEYYHKIKQKRRIADALREYDELKRLELLAVGRVIRKIDETSNKIKIISGS